MSQADEARWAVVTGASRGIGRATALSLARRGLHLALVGRPSPDLESTLSLVLEAGAPEARAFHADLADESATEAVGRTLAELPAVEVLVNNAGIARRKSVEETSTASFHEQLAVNLTAPFVLSRELLPSMRRRGRGRIVHVGSISSTLGTPRLAAYCAAKWGLIGLMKSLAEELHDSGVMTLAVLPGSVDTRMLEGSGFPPRMNADEVAKTIAYFALDAPTSHNGSVIEMFGV